MGDKVGNKVGDKVGDKILNVFEKSMIKYDWRNCTL